MGRYEEALKTLKECLVIKELALGKDHPDYATTLNSIGSALVNKGRYEEALKNFKECLVIQ